MGKATYSCGHTLVCRGKKDKQLDVLCRFCKGRELKKEIKDMSYQAGYAAGLSAGIELASLEETRDAKKAEVIRVKLLETIISLLSAVTRPGWWVYRADKTPIQILRDLQREKHPHLYQIVDDILEDVEE